MMRNPISQAIVLLLPVLTCGSAAVSDPTPILLDKNGTWIIDPTATFGSSGLTFKVRRFVRIPDPAPNDFPTTRPRLNALRFAPGDDRLFIVDAGLAFSEVPPSTGALYAVAADGSSVEQIFNVGTALNNRFGAKADMVHLFSAQGGLRSVAFHPCFNQEGSPGFGALYTTQLQGRPADLTNIVYLGPSMPTGANMGYADSVLSEWTAVFDSRRRMIGVDPNSYREVFRIAVPDIQHPIKQIAFNPHAQREDEDYGLLYILHGDGTNSATEGTGQDGSTALGKVIRVDPLSEGANSYSVPSTNPFIGIPTMLDELYTIGHRNPHTISFTQDGDCNTHIFISEIGHGSVEEINLLRPGGDFGWGQREGTFVRVDFLSVSSLPLDDAVHNFVYPLAQYGHHPRIDRHAIAGGYAIDNGSELDGYYMLGDFTRGRRPFYAFALADAPHAVVTGDPGLLSPVDLQTVGVVFDHDDDPATAYIERDSFRDIIDDELSYDDSGRTDLRFGQGPKGELYLLNKRNGWVYLVVNSAPSDRQRFDVDGDGRINLLDFATMAKCLQGPGGDVPGACTRCGLSKLDADADGDVDMLEAKAFLNAYTGN